MRELKDFYKFGFSTNRFGMFLTFRGYTYAQRTESSNLEIWDEGGEQWLDIGSEGLEYEELEFLYWAFENAWKEYYIHEDDIERRTKWQEERK